MRESFVVHSEYIEDLPEEYKSKFLMYVYDYGIKDIEPKLEGLEQSIWLKIQRRIDADKTSYTERVEYVSQYNQYKKDLKNGTITKDVTFEQWKLNNLKHLKCFKTFEKFSNNSTNTDTNTNTNTPPVFVNDIVNVNDNVSDIVNVSDIDIVNDIVNVNESENVSVELPSTLTPAQTKYSDTIFELFKNANLPCAKDNPISFRLADFSNAMRYLHSTAEYAHIHSDAVIGAVKNYIEVLQDKNCYIKTKMNFFQLVKSKMFYNLLPANYDRENYVNFKTADKPKTAEEDQFKELCPQCNTVNLIWKNNGEKYTCLHCGAELSYEEVHHE